MNNIKKVFIILCTVSVSLVAQAQKGNTAIYVNGGFESFMFATSSSNNLSGYVEVGWKKYVSDRFFSISSLSISKINQQSNQLLLSHPNKLVPDIYYTASYMGNRQYLSTGLGYDFWRLCNNHHRFYVALETGFVRYRQITDTKNYNDSHNLIPTDIHIEKGYNIEPFLRGNLGYDFYITDNLSAGVVCNMLIAEYGGDCRMGLKIGYTF